MAFEKAFTPIVDHVPASPNSSSDDSSKDQGRRIVIAVLGAPGSGKSSFINLASGSNLPVSDSYSAGTLRVEMAPSFELAKSEVVLIDTPGFDNVGSGTTILKGIKEIFEEKGVLVNKHTRITMPVIYLHRTFDVMPCFLDRLLRLCESLGRLKNSLEHVIVVVNMWDAQAHVTHDLKREVAEVQEFFKPALEKGAQFFCHDNTRSSAQTILQRVYQCWPGGEGYVTAQEPDDEVNVRRRRKRRLPPASDYRRRQRQAQRIRERRKQRLLEDDIITSRSCWGLFEM